MSPLIRWLIGSLVGTFLVGITSPIFVRSYLANASVRGTVTYPPGSHYRWRSEGYATTAIGPYGMPGRTSVAPDRPPKKRIALYGDSQVEGVAVDDRGKLFAAIEQASAGEVAAYPLAQSGDALGNWLAQMSWAESELGVDEHWIVIVDIEDLTDVSSPEPPTGERLRTLASKFPAFLVVAARNTLFDSDDNPRQLRFGLGQQRPLAKQSAANQPSTRADASKSDASDLIGGEEDWDAIFARVKQVTSLPITIIHAPMRPAIVGGRVIEKPRYSDSIFSAREAAVKAEIRWLSVEDAFARSAEAGIWPHGFHNGNIGRGHLNADGNRVIAETIVSSESL